jgi:lipopolysaccharide transport system ATP-binding protein
MTPAIDVQNLSKMYRIGMGNVGLYRTLRETVSDGVKKRLRRLKNGTHGEAKASDFWALRDVNFKVNPGEVVGIIGANGAGKSTLLKIISRITPPTRGRIDLRGRVGSLLEVGTGFHPELTGRENVYLNAAILGMRRTEIARKFDEIVDFAEIGQFLDTPVKRYSSGMYTRLAFAVASHLEPEVLLVDEVLAVGDAGFQKKCLGKMDEVSRAGRTILFVSHNMGAIKSLCQRAILLEKGRVVCDGSPGEVVNRYLAQEMEMARTGIISETAPRFGSGMARLRSVKITNTDGLAVSQLYFRQPFRVTVEVDVLKDMSDGVFEVSVSDLDGNHVICNMTTDGGSAPLELAKGRHTVSVEMENPLLPRRYTLDLAVHRSDGSTEDYVQRTFDFAVLKVAEEDEDHFRWITTRGFVRTGSSWQVQSAEAVA